MMADENWQKVREIFDAAVCRPPEERKTYIQKACGRNETLLAEVESLLSSHDSAESFLETPAVAKVADIIESDSRKLERGVCFAHYEIIEQIGAGGMGEVYLAEDKKLDRQVAVKILNAQFSRDESNLSRFTREAKAASALNHPNILVIHEIGETDEAHYIVSEYIRGKTLREVLQKKPLKLAEALDITIQIASALVAAHEARLVHRDIKPENIMIRPDGFVKILDFGLAKLVEQKNEPVLGGGKFAGQKNLSVLELDESIFRAGQTAKGVILGTVNYMSPEQARGQQIDERTDIFSLGAVVYEMLTGRTPFEGSSIAETFANLMNTEPLPLSRFTANVPAELERLVFKSLRKNREERYQTMKEVLTDLKDLSRSPTTKRGTINEDAYWLYLQAKNLTATHFPQDARAAVGYFENAIRLDPNFARAYAGLALAYVIASQGGGGSQNEFNEKAKRAVTKALELDNNLGEGHAVLGEIEFSHEWNFPGAEKNLRRAIELEPDSELGHAVYGEYLATQGRFDEAVSEIKIALEIEPKSCANQIIYGRILYFARRYDDAIVQFNRVIEVFPSWTTAYGWTWLTYELKRNYAKAYEWLILNQKQNNVQPERIEAYQNAYREAGWRGMAKKLFEFERPQSPSANYYAPARHCIRLGEKELAFKYLNKAFDNRQYQMTWLNVDPFFDPVRGDPNFDEIVKRIGLS